MAFRSLTAAEGWNKWYLKPVIDIVNIPVFFLCEGYFLICSDFLVEF